MAREHFAQGPLTHLIFIHPAPAGCQRRAQVGERDREGVLTLVEELGRMEDLGGRARRVPVERAHGRPRPALPELVREGEAVGVGEEQEVLDEPRGAVEDGSDGLRRDQLLDSGEVRDQRFARQELIALAAGRADEAVEGDLAILEGVDQLVHERGLLLLRGEPVGEHHDLAHRVVVSRRLLLHEVEEEGAQVEVGRGEPPGDHRFLLGLDLGRGVFAVQLLVEEAPRLAPGADHDGRRRAR